MSESAPIGLTTLEGLSSYLGGDVAVQCLSGGMANYVYRVTDQESGEKSVYKHAASHLSSNPDFAFDARRMDYEAHILRNLQHLEDCDTNVRAVQLLGYDEDQKLLKLGDGGFCNLKAAYNDLNLDISTLAQGLAKWLATLHMRSRDMSLSLEISDETKSKGNNPIAVQIYRHSYINLHTALSHFNHNPDLAHRINNLFGTLLSSDDECVCHGDFWPGNVLIDNQNVTIVDWEMCRRGTSATDVGQFCAESWLLDRFRGGRGLMGEFLRCYLRERNGGGDEVGREWLQRVAVHWAVHVAYWPTRVGWTDHEGTKELVDIGVEVLRSVPDGDWEELKASPLFEGVDVVDILSRE